MSAGEIIGMAGTAWLVVAAAVGLYLRRHPLPDHEETYER